MNEWTNGCYHSPCQRGRLSALIATIAPTYSGTVQSVYLYISRRTNRGTILSIVLRIFMGIQVFIKADMSEEGQVLFKRPLCECVRLNAGGVSCEEH